MNSKQKNINVVEDSIAIRMGKDGEKLIKSAINKNIKQSFKAYAAPMAWGPDVTVASHIGQVTYSISYEAIGDTLVIGRVSYFKGPGGGNKVKEEFKNSTTITTSNAVANVICEFKGIPTGSAVDVSID